jgi:ABC-type dipeptide/oligopeptide/nickel transport system permease subunit
MLRWKTFTVGLAITGLFVLTTLLAPVIAPYPPDATDYGARLQPPSAAHWFGTDHHGRDLLSRILYGGRVSLQVGALATLLSSLVAMPLGLTAGYFGGWYDGLVGRFTDAMLAFPGILWAIVLVAILGPSATSATLAIAVSRIPLTIRLSRAAIIAEKENEYVEASRVLNSSWRFIVFRSILPNSAGPLLVLVSLGFAVAILTEAGLGYLGLSVQPPTPSWGNMLQESQSYLYESGWFIFFPGATLFLVVLGLNLVGDGIRDLVDPRREVGRRA